MTKKEGLVLMDSVIQNLAGTYATLDELYSQITRPVAPDVQKKAEEIMQASIGISCMALNFMEMPPEAKKPFAALLYAAADAFSGGDGND